MIEKNTAPAPERTADLIVLAAERGALKKAVFSKCDDKTILRIALTPRVIGRKIVAQVESFLRDNKATHENVPLENSGRVAELCAACGQVDLITTVGNAALLRSKSGNFTLIGEGKLRAALQSADAPRVEIGSNNLEKHYILNGSEPFLKLLGVSDGSGRVKDKKQSKFRQINRFLELIRDCLPALPREGELRICDLCCGKSYLSFAVYHYFANILGRTVRMTGVDLKPDVIAECREVALRAGFDGLEFLCGDISDYRTETPVHLVISLHACDVATDLVLGKALEWQADVILSTPCCHHELNHAIDCPTLSFVAEHSMLRQKLCDAATDALRLKHLQACGYSVAALELIDPEDTPKNVMLRGIRRKDFDPDSAEALRLWEEYRAAKRFLTGTDEGFHF